MLARWHSRTHAIVLAITCVVSTAWLAVIVQQALLGTQPSLLIHFLEILRDVCWILFLLALLRPYQDSMHFLGLNLIVLIISILGCYLFFVAVSAYTGWTI